MGTFSPPGGAAESPRGIVIGVGNPYYGDDAIGLAVARAVHRQLAREQDWTLAELCCSAFGVIERLGGHRRAIIIDALVDEQTPPGTLVEVAFPEASATPVTGFHTVAFGEALALARVAGIELPSRIGFYAVAIRPPEGFSEGLSPELQARVETLAAAILQAEREHGP